MKALQSITVFLVVSALCFYKQKEKPMQDKVRQKNFCFSVEEEDVEPPPPDFVSKYNSLEEWLTAICKKEKPAQTDLDYVVGLFESGADFTVYLTGRKEYQKSQHESIIKIEFEPKDMYFNLPKTDDEGRTNEQVRKQVADQLVAFSKTPAFQNSFFASAATLKVEWQIDTIWKKN